MGSTKLPRLKGPRHEIARGDPLYPETLDAMTDRPAKLHVVGDPAALHGPCVSIVGSRKATPYGIACAELAARIAVDMGISVTSGAAVGCDQAAQREALRMGGRVLAVLGSGADVVYPASSRGMLERIVETGGAVVSMLPWGSEPTRWTFVRRNGVIAALARALVICEAGMPSGTFSTAQGATEAGREVLVFPGSVFSPNSTGSNYLIASDPNTMPIWDRACLELAFSRIYGVLRSPRREGSADAPRQEGLGRQEVLVLEALEASAMRPAELAAALEVELTRVLRLLGGLELGGRVSRLADGRYCLTKTELMAHNMGRMRDGTVRR